MAALNIQYKLETKRGVASGVDAARLSNAMGTTVSARLRKTCGPNVEVRQESLFGVEGHSFTVASMSVDRNDSTPLDAADYRYCDEAFVNACKANFTGGSGWSTAQIVGALPARGSGDGRVSILGDVKTIERIVSQATPACSSASVPSALAISHEVVSSTTPSEIGTRVAPGLTQAATNAARSIQNTVNTTLGEYKTPAIVGSVIVLTLVGGFFVWRVTAK